jgi:hypothetical protein
MAAALLWLKNGTDEEMLSFLYKTKDFKNYSLENVNNLIKNFREVLNIPIISCLLNRKNKRRRSLCKGISYSQGNSIWTA